jgi:hypothetical protein
LRINRESKTTLCSKQEKATTILRNSKVSRIQDAIWQQDVVAKLTKLFDNLIEKLPMLPYC